MIQLSAILQNNLRKAHISLHLHQCLRNLRLWHTVERFAHDFFLDLWSGHLHNSLDVLFPFSSPWRRSLRCQTLNRAMKLVLFGRISNIVVLPRIQILHHLQPTSRAQTRMSASLAQFRGLGNPQCCKRRAEFRTNHNRSRASARCLLSRRARAPSGEQRSRHS